MPLNRRRFLSSAVTSGLATVLIGTFQNTSRAASPQVKLLDTRVISQQPEFYHGWPTVARRRNGELLVVWSGGREEHVCPFGRVELMTSRDDGTTWTWPRVLLDSATDDRDAGAMETAQGTLLVTTFTSLAYESSLNGRKNQDRAWQAAHARINAAQRNADLGQWMLRSTDGGVTWSERYPSIVNSPHGPIQLSDGRLLYAGKELWTGRKRTGVCESKDDGRTWQWLTEIPVRAGDDPDEYHELHVAEVGEGRLILQIRNENRVSQNQTLQSESSDAGLTWSIPHEIGVWGVPSFLTRLRDGRLLMSYGHRRAPLGNQARISVDQGRTWSEPMVISADGTSGDLGYPSTVELADGTLLTVWYERLKDSPRAVLRQARWTIAM
jgi:hypothetical protein